MEVFGLYTARLKQYLSNLVNPHKLDAPDYIYEELLQERSIRLLTLEPGSKNQTLAGNLAVTLIADAPPYEALSYVWGDAADRLPTRCSSGRLDVTTNLHTALRHLRLKNQARVLWIDALCIDQENLIERGQQVLLMRDIYSKARQVLIWLGPESKDDRKAFDFVLWVQELSASVSDSFNDYLDPSDEDYENLVVNGQFAEAFVSIITQGKNGPPWKHFAHLFTRPWFQRIWVIQEVASTAHAIVICGYNQITWQPLAKAAKLFLMMGLVGNVDRAIRGAVVNSLENVLVISKYRRWVVNHSLTLVSALTYSRDFKSTDSRDKIYGILGFLSEQDVPFVPDYKMACNEVFKRASVMELVCRKRLDFLSCTSYLHTPSDLKHLPSWVPDWSLTEDRIPLVVTRVDFRAAGDSSPQVQLSSDGDVLIAEGKLLRRVAKIGKLEFSGLEVAKSDGKQGTLQSFYLRLLDAVQRRLDWLEECHSIACEDRVDKSTDFYSTPLPISFVQSLFCDAGGSGGRSSAEEFASQFKFQHRDMARYIKIIERMHEELNGDDQVMTRSEEEDSEEIAAIPGLVKSNTLFEARLISEIAARKYCRTSDGRVGWVPRRTAVGDAICLLYGGKVLHVLRPTHNGQYMLIGEAYVQGLMHGEGVKMTEIDSQAFCIE